LRNLLGVTSLIVVSASWLLFGLLAYCGQIGGFGTHYVTLRASSMFFLVTFCAAASCTSLEGKSRTFSVSAGFLMAALWAGAQLVA